MTLSACSSYEVCLYVEVKNSFLHLHMKPNLSRKDICDGMFRVVASKLYQRKYDESAFAILLFLLDFSETMTI